MPRYGQIVVGPPGSGKSTYCNGLQQYLSQIGRRTLVVNFDPANDANTLPYPCVFNVITELVSLSTVQNQYGLGPNGGLLWAMEYMEKEVEFIMDKIESNIKAYEFESASTSPQADAASTPDNSDVYLLFDFPGQIELFTHNTCVQNIIAKFIKRDYRLAGVQLIDAHHCSDTSKFIAAVMVATTSMIRLELPMINVLSKVR